MVMSDEQNHHPSDSTKSINLRITCFSQIVLPKIFSWYANDFGDNPVKWIANYLQADRSVQIRKLLESGQYTVSYEHSWEPVIKLKQKI
jgi:hypothetical protein